MMAPMMNNTDYNNADEVAVLFTQTDKKLVAELPRFLYEGPIVVVVGEAEAERAVAHLRRAAVLGIDTETRPSFKRGDKHKVALLQVASEEICFLFRLNLMGLPDCLVNLLADPEVMKVGLSLRDDFHMLRQRREFEPGGCLDLQTFVARMGIKDLSLQKLYANIFRQRISKNARLTNWEADALTEAQKRYAATDAYACIRLYHRLNELQTSGRFRLLPAPEPPVATGHEKEKSSQHTHTAKA